MTSRFVDCSLCLMIFYWTGWHLFLKRCALCSRLVMTWFYQFFSSGFVLPWSFFLLSLFLPLIHHLILTLCRVIQCYNHCCLPFRCFLRVSNNILHPRINSPVFILIFILRWSFNKQASVYLCSTDSSWDDVWQWCFYCESGCWFWHIR